VHSHKEASPAASNTSGMTTHNPRAVGQLLDRLDARADEIGEAVVGAIVEQVPAYRTAPIARVAHMRQIVHQNVRELFRVVREGRPAGLADLEEFRESVRSAARQGIAVEDVLHAYRLGATVGSMAIADECQAGGPGKFRAGLEVLGRGINYLDQVSIAVAQSYVEERERIATDEERVYREIFEGLLSEGCSSAEVAERAARVGVKLASGYWVALVSMQSAPGPSREVARHFRNWPLSHPVIAVPKQHHVGVLWPAEREDPPVELTMAVASLDREQGSVLAALAGPTAGPLQSAHAEAAAILRLCTSRHAGVVRLEDVLLDAAVHQLGGRTEQLLRASVEPILAYDRRRDAGLVETLAAYISVNGSLSGAAAAVHAHRNTIMYRLVRIRELTGLDPSSFQDLFILQAGVRLAEASCGPDPELAPRKALSQVDGGG